MSDHQVSNTEPSSAEAARLSLVDTLDRRTAKGSLFCTEGDRIRCVACGHRCLIAPGRRGICKVRFNRSSELRVPFGYVAGLACDPVEKKPFFHVFPGSDALTFGMLGCDFHCGYCQNWVTSQALRDPQAVTNVMEITPEQIVGAAKARGARLVVSSYNEPLITAEWAVAVFQQAKALGLTCAFVSNGNLTMEALQFLRPWISAYKIDLKSFDDRHYRSLGGTLNAVLDGIRMVKESGLWLELVTLIVPGFNDTERELRDIASFIASVGPEIPWHVTAFHQDYRMRDPANTATRQLIRAAEIGTEAGLKFVYAGNAPGRVGRWENTYCPGCGELLVERIGYYLPQVRLQEGGSCFKCHTRLPGIWADTAVQVN